jgi:hypothetical protein
MYYLLYIHRTRVQLELQLCSVFHFILPPSKLSCTLLSVKLKCWKFDHQYSKKISTSTIPNTYSYNIDFYLMIILIILIYIIDIHIFFYITVIGMKPLYRF